MSRTGLVGTAVLSLACACSADAPERGGSAPDPPPPAWKMSHSVIAEVPRARAWALQSDVRQWERVEGGAVDSIRLDGPSEAGSRCVTYSPGQPPTTFASLAPLEGQEGPGAAALADAMDQIWETLLPAGMERVAAAMEERVVR